MSLLLVRHAVALARRKWDGADEHRPLTERGVAQAAGLVDLLRDYDVAAVLSSPAVRCVDTITPLAKARGLEVECVDQLAEGARTAALSLIEARRDGLGLVLCSHGDVLPELLAKLTGVGYDAPFAKGATWVVERDGAGLYLPPPAPPASSE